MSDSERTDPALSEAGSVEPEPLRIERSFRAPIEAVFDAWTSVDVLRRWWPAGADWEVVDAETDARVGGRVRLSVRTPNGDRYGGEGRYTQVHRPDRLACTWQWDEPAGRPGQLVDITFAAIDDGTTAVVMINTGIGDTELADHGRGWSLSFDHLESLLGREYHPASFRKD